MKRNYESGVADTITFFVGVEIEHTPAHGMQTLFVVDLQRTATVLRHAEKNSCKHIYFGANHSYKVMNGQEVQSIASQLQYFLERDYHVTIDMNPAYKGFSEITKLLSYPKFTIVYGVTVENVKDIQLEFWVGIEYSEKDRKEGGVLIAHETFIHLESYINDLETLMKKGIVSKESLAAELNKISENRGHSGDGDHQQWLKGKKQNFGKSTDEMIDKTPDESTKTTIKEKYNGEIEKYHEMQKTIKKK